MDKNIKLPLDINISLSTYKGSLEKADIFLIGIPLYIKTVIAKPYLKPTNFLRICKDLIEDNSIIYPGKYYSDMKLIDLGDISSINYDDIEIDISTIIDALSRYKKKFLFIGGEHTFTYYIVKKLKPNNLIVFDAHLDMKNRFYYDRVNHATFLRRLSEELDINIFLIGSRAYDKEEFNYASSHKRIMIKDDTDWRELDGDTYISIDLDILNPLYFKSTGYLELGGLKLGDLLKIIKDITENSDVIGADIMEYIPHAYEIRDAVQVLRLIYEIAIMMHLEKRK